MGSVSPAIGQIVTRWQVEQAVISTLNTWLPMYVSEVERQMGQPENALDRFTAVYGSLDTEGKATETGPWVLVEAQPTGDGFRDGGGTLSEWYLVKVASICIQGNEADTRLLTDAYGAAVEAAVLQGWSQTDPVDGINALASDLAVRVPPETTFFDVETTRNMMIATVEFEAFVSDTVSSAVGGLGTVEVPVDDFDAVPDPPTVATTHVTFIGESADGSTTETNPE